MPILKGWASSSSVLCLKILLWNGIYQQKSLFGGYREMQWVGYSRGTGPCVLSCYTDRWKQEKFLLFWLLIKNRHFLRPSRSTPTSQQNCWKRRYKATGLSPCHLDNQTTLPRYHRSVRAPRTSGPEVGEIQPPHFSVSTQRSATQFYISVSPLFLGTLPAVRQQIMANTSPDLRDRSYLIYCTASPWVLLCVNGLL